MNIQQWENEKPTDKEKQDIIEKYEICKSVLRNFRFYRLFLFYSGVLLGTHIKSVTYQPVIWFLQQK